MENPQKKHWEAVKGFMSYLKGTQDLCICFGRQDAKVHAYVDSDYVGYPDNGKSTYFYIHKRCKVMDIKDAKMHGSLYY